jgi:hypothetical protein
MPTENQFRIAEKLGIDINADTEAVAAARILTSIAEAIGDLRSAAKASERQIAFARSLGINVSTDSSAIASAKISDVLYLKNREALDRLNLKPGDAVRKRSKFVANGEMKELVEEAVISSIQPNLRIFFKGGNGRGAWPTDIEKI